jgi:hypothetical protein
VKRAKKRAVLKPPPTFQDSHRGAPTIAEISAMLGKLSLPAASAGRGAFLMAGYCDLLVSIGVNKTVAAAVSLS